jgi:hypothetical protein
MIGSTISASLLRGWQTYPFEGAQGWAIGWLPRSFITVRTRHDPLRRATKLDWLALTDAPQVMTRRRRKWLFLYEGENTL